MVYYSNLMETLATKLPPSLVRGIDTLVRQGRYPNRSDALRDAVRRLLESGGATIASSERRVFEARVKSYRAQMRRLGRDPRYRGRWVAVHRDVVIDHDADMDALLRRVLARKEQPVQIGRADPEGRLPVVRIPGVRARPQ